MVESRPYGLLFKIYTFTQELSKSCPEAHVYFRVFYTCEYQTNFYKILTKLKAP